MKVLNSSILILSTLLFCMGCKNKTNTTATAPVLKLPVMSAADNQAIIAREISTWEFGKTKNFAGLNEIYADDFTALFGKNVMSKNDVISTFQNSIVRSYHLSNIKVKPLIENAAVIYYQLDQDVIDINGEPWTPLVASSTTYVKRNKNWYAVFYQETQIK